MEPHSTCKQLAIFIKRVSYVLTFFPPLAELLEPSINCWIRIHYLLRRRATTSFPNSERCAHPIIDDFFEIVEEGCTISMGHVQQVLFQKGCTFFPFEQFASYAQLTPTNKFWVLYWHGGRKSQAFYVLSQHIASRSWNGLFLNRASLLGVDIYYAEALPLLPDTLT